MGSLCHPGFCDLAMCVYVWIHGWWKCLSACAFCLRISPLLFDLTRVKHTDTSRMYKTFSTRRDSCSSIDMSRIDCGLCVATHSLWWGAVDSYVGFGMLISFTYTPTTSQDKNKLKNEAKSLPRGSRIFFTTHRSNIAMMIQYSIFLESSSLYLREVICSELYLPLWDSIDAQRLFIVFSRTPPVCY